jgi:hypothetical protein
VIEAYFRLKRADAAAQAAPAAVTPVTAATVVGN